MYNFQCSNCLKPIPSISQQILDLDRNLIMVSEMLWRERLANNFRMQQTQIQTIVPDQNIENDFQKHKKFKTVQQDPIESTRNQFRAISVSSSNKEQSLEKIRQIQQQRPLAPQQSVINPFISLFFQDTNTSNPNIHPNNQAIQDNDPVQKTNQIYCPVCLKQFSSSYSKNRHIKQVHQFLNESGTQIVSNYQDYLNLNKDTINDYRPNNFQNNQKHTDIDNQDNKKNDFNQYTYYKNYSHSFDQYLDNTQNNNNKNNNNENANNDRNNNSRNNKNTDKNNKNNAQSNQHQKQNKQSITNASNHSAISEFIQAQCPICYKLFSHKSSKDKHLKKAHNIQNSQYITPSNIKNDYLDKINLNKLKNNDNASNLKLMLRNSDLNKNNNNDNNNKNNNNKNNINNNNNNINNKKTNKFDLNIRSNGSSVSKLPNINIPTEIDKKQCPICFKMFSVVSSKDRHLKEVHKIQNKTYTQSLQIPKAFQEYLYQKNSKNTDSDIEIDIQVENEKQNINDQSPQMNQTNNQDKNNENIVENIQENTNQDNSNTDNIIILDDISNNMDENQQKQQKLGYVYNDDDDYNDNDNDGDSYLNQELICQICQKQFKSNAAVMRHFLIQHSKAQQDEDLICLDCDIRFENDERKQFHLKHVHGN